MRNLSAFIVAGFVFVACGGMPEQVADEPSGLVSPGPRFPGAEVPLDDVPSIEPGDDRLPDGPIQPEDIWHTVETARDSDLCRTVVDYCAQDTVVCATAHDALRIRLEHVARVEAVSVLGCVERARR